MWCACGSCCCTLVWLHLRLIYLDNKLVCFCPHNKDLVVVGNDPPRCPWGVHGCDLCPLVRVQVVELSRTQHFIPHKSTTNVHLVTNVGDREFFNTMTSSILKDCCPNKILYPLLSFQTNIISSLGTFCLYIYNRLWHFISKFGKILGENCARI